MAEFDQLDPPEAGKAGTLAALQKVRDSLLGDLPSIVSDLKRIDTAWTALEGQIDKDCG